ncbi:MAG TPA: amidase [Thermoleophilaceae bacterium]|nr:amidase [Thermoleophilaceae bacterium]
MDPRLDATGQAALVRSGEVSARELVEGAIERVEGLNGELNAVIHPLFEKALASEPADGPFSGVPMVVKDLACHTAGDPYHEGMGFLKRLGWREEEDSWLARRFREAGFVFVGRTNTPELGILPTTEPEAYGATRNPWDPGHSAGGSSGGSAAAVAAGMVPIGHANDGGGSIRIPASSCGLVGLKPSRGRVSAAPDFGDVMSGLTQELVVSRSVRDTAAVLEWVSDPPPGEPYVAPARARSYEEEVGADPGQLRVGLYTKPPGGQFDSHPECVAAAEEAGLLLESLGHVIEPSYPEALDDERYIPNFLVRWSAGVDWNLKYWSDRTGQEIGPDDVEALTWALAEMGRSHTAGEYLRAVEYAQLVTRRAAEWWTGGFDVLLTPTLSLPPLPLGSYEPDPENPLLPIVTATPVAVFTAGFNATGQPAISLPLYASVEGLPIGVQLVAAYGREDVLLRVAAQLEEAAPWADRTPPIFAGASA